jgi:signal transduction histidine kinase
VQLRKALYPYGIAVLAIILATVARLLLDPVVGEMHPFITYIYAIIFSAWYCGLWPALLSVLLGFLSAAYFFAYPRGSIAVYGIDLQVGMTLYIFVGMSSIFFCESLRKARRRAENTAEALMSKSTALEQEIEKRIETESEREDLLRRIVHLQEQERQRISRELHDQCGQDLVALQLNLEYLKSRLLQQEGAVRSQGEQTLDDASRILSNLGREIHSLAFDLRPPCLDDLGLPTAIESLLEYWRKRSGLEFDFECPAWDHSHVTPEVSLVFYRVLQEAVSNAIKHSRCRRVTVVLEMRKDVLVQIIEDDGIGMDNEPNPTTTSEPMKLRLGITGMQERLRTIGGSLVIESETGKGTTVFARVPLRSKFAD